MKIDRNTIEEIASLAKLKLTPEEEKDMIKDLNKVLELMDKLHTIDTDSVLPFTHFDFQTDSLRKDIPNKIPFKNATLKNAPLTDSNYFLVPKVIKYDNG